MGASPHVTAVPWFKRPLLWVRKLYDWTLSWAETPYGTPALFALAFVEASFFPIPPDVLLMALAMGRPRRAAWFAGICTAGSVLGAVLGWYIGLGLWGAMGTYAECPQFGGGGWMFDAVPGFTCDAFATVKQYYDDNAWMALFTAAFTPIPFKVFTIAAGVFQVSLVTLLAASVVGRGARFFGLGVLICFFGPQVKGFIEKRFELVTVVFAVLLVGGFVLVKYVM